MSAPDQHRDPCAVPCRPEVGLCCLASCPAGCQHSLKNLDFKNLDFPRFYLDGWVTGAASDPP